MGHKTAFLFFCATGLLAAAACAQAPPPLNLKLPAGGAPASATTVAQPAAPSQPAATQPGTYYGDTSGRMGNTVANVPAPACDDSTYNQPQVHGDVGMGVMSGSRVGTGSYETGTVNISKRYGSCDEPSGGVSMSISVGQSHFGGSRGRW